MIEYKFMDSVVDEICHSMINNPERWEMGTYIVTDKKSGISYWHSENYKSITQTWRSGKDDKVFSEEQGMRIYQAFKIMRENSASGMQKRVIMSFKETDKLKRWWEFWK